MKRTHNTHVEARTELGECGFFTLGPDKHGSMTPLRWARPGNKSDVRVVRREIIDADERWVIEKYHG